MIIGNNVLILPSLTTDGTQRFLLHDVIDDGVGGYMGYQIKIRINDYNSVSGLDVLILSNGGANSSNSAISLRETQNNLVKPVYVIYRNGNLTPYFTFGDIKGEIRTININYLNNGENARTPRANPSNGATTLFGSGINPNAKVTFYYLIATKGQDIVAEIVPCIKNGTLCLYNKMSKEFYFNVN